MKNELTLRDYFAAKVLQGLMSIDTDFSYESVATMSYRQADAMLKERATAQEPT